MQIIWVIISIPFLSFIWVCALLGNKEAVRALETLGDIQCQK